MAPIVDLGIPLAALRTTEDFRRLPLKPFYHLPTSYFNLPHVPQYISRRQLLHHGLQSCLAVSSENGTPRSLPWDTIVNMYFSQQHSSPHNGIKKNRILEKTQTYSCRVHLKNWNYTAAKVHMSTSTEFLVVECHHNLGLSWIGGCGMYTMLTRCACTVDIF
jgi:hypothetical protein